MPRRLAAIVTVWAAVLLAVPTPAAADRHGRGRDNVVVVTNHSDGSLRARSGTAVSHDPGPTVANQNVAYARASCTNCRTAAVAVQVVLVEGPTNDFRPENVALAVNENCHSCQTFAYARQEVLSPGREVRLSDDAEEQVDEVSDQIDEVARSSESFPEMAADLDGLTERLVAIVRSEIERAGPTGGDEDHREVHEQDA